MLLKGEQLAAHLEKNLHPLYVVHGDAPLLVIEAADAIRAKARQAGHTEREVLTVLPGFDWNQLSTAGAHLSLFGDRKLIDLRLPNGKPGREGGAALQAWCAQTPNPDTLLLITLPELDWKEEKAAWYNALAQTGVILKLNTPSLAELPNWIAQRLARQQQKAAADGLRFMAERIEGNLLAAHQEIQKLGLLYPAGLLSLEHIRNAVLNVARYDLDGLREALLLGDTARFVRTLEGLRQEGEAPPLILWALTEDIRTLASIAIGLRRGRPSDALFREAKVWGARQGLIKRALERHTEHTLIAALQQAAGIDPLIKGLRPGSAWDAFTHLGLSVIRPG